MDTIREWRQLALALATVTGGLLRRPRYGIWSLAGILSTVTEDEQNAFRSDHATSQGLLQVSMTVPPDIPRESNQGIFTRHGRHDAVMRLSASLGMC
ncbi:hypothetical protein [Paracoccus rhizosphaerae]|uniref:hypothetical protein n=1 Tax=Paracoccus rhizosphaerae TaxID=1133347 RepID=UPI00360C0FCD